MKLTVALGVAFAALTVAATAQPERDRVFVQSGGGHMIGTQDADEDGWVSRAEASAAADRIFGDLDRNDDGKLDDADRPSPDHFSFESSGEDGERIVIVRRDGESAPHVRVFRDGEEVEEHDHEAHDNERHVERHVDRRVDRRVERTDDRNVTIIRRDGDHDEHHAMAPMPPMPPHPPMFLAMLGNNEEFDRNGDGALSQEEFRTQHLRQFDAQDGNGDGRVRAPEPMHLDMRAPEPPEAPQPPTPPRRR